MADLIIKSFDDCELHGEIILPDDSPEFIAIFLHGSFLQDRNGNFDSPSWMFPLEVNKRNLFRDTAIYLQSKGIGSFLFDKRASGKSAGEYHKTTMDDLALDAAVLLLEIKHRYPQSKVGFIAQSEGTITALSSVFRGAKPDFLVLQGTLLCGLQQLLDFQRHQVAAVFLDNPSDEIMASFPYYTALYRAFYEGDLLDKIFNTRLQITELKIGDNVFPTNLEKYRGYDIPKIPMLMNVPCPTLIIHGDKDANCSIDDLRKTAKTIDQSENRDRYTVRILKDHDHSFRHVTEDTNFIQALALPLSPNYLAELDLFLIGLTK